MPTAGSTLLQRKALNGWGLFSLIVLPTSAAVVLVMTRVDLSQPAEISAMIQLSVRLAVPWLFIAFAASSLAVVFPSAFTNWLLRNRRIVGLCFAAGMVWQLLFILWMVFGHFNYYLQEAYSYFDLSEQISGYLVLVAMTLTSFPAGRRMLGPKQWGILHKGGIYFLWAVIWSTYWFELYYYDDIQFIDYVYYWMGFAAWGVRVAAWSKKRGMVAVRGLASK